MKILVVTPRFPYPPAKGDQIVPFQRLRILGKRHAITLLTLYENRKELEGIRELAPLCTAIHPVHLSKWKSLIQVALRGSFTRTPLQCIYYDSALLATEMRALLSKEAFDVILVFMLRLAPCVAAMETAVPKLLDLIDSMQLNVARRLAITSRPIRWILNEELRRLAPFEQNLFRGFADMVVVGEEDRKYIRNGNVHVVPLGVDVDYFQPNIQLRPVDPTVIFSGNIRYPPNEDAAIWFVDNCVARIRQTVPNVQFVIAGRNPRNKVRQLCGKLGVAVSGYVESMPDTLNAAHVAVAPMRSGSGMQFKILEAMACGLPIVTTRIGLGSIGAHPDREIVVAESAEDFCTKISMLLTNTSVAGNIGFAARQFVERNHRSTDAGLRIEQLLISLVKRKDT